MKTLLTATIAVSALIIGQIANAAVIMVAPTSILPGSLQITQDIVFPVNAAGGLQTIVFDDWVLGFDGSYNLASSTQPILYSFNAGPTTALGTSSLVGDNYGTPGPVVPALDGRDGLLISPSASLTVVNGDIFTLKAGLYPIAPVAGFNPATTQTFNGNAFLATLTGIALSPRVPVTTIPEPSSLLALGLSSILLLNLRNRKKI